MVNQQMGVIGLGVMGMNLALNIEDNRYSVSVYDYWTDRTDDFLGNQAKGKNIQGHQTLEDFVTSLEVPRKILMMVKAGDTTDSVIQSLIPLLEKGDILIDGGNTFFEDTNRRAALLRESGIHFIGAGVSGGEEGARFGPSLMLGGSFESYEKVEPILSAISAKVDGTPCSAYMGNDGAGHYVKMVHNGIEYGDMQLISEAYFMMKHILGLTASELHDVFSEWNKGELDSYLIEITADIFTKVDEETNEPLIDKILDAAAQKGTGKWTSQNALDLGISLPIVTESVFARCMSSIKDERVAASKILTGPTINAYEGDADEFIEAIRKALYMSKICSYAQGFAQLRAASEEYDWAIPFGDVAMIFRGGCIIQARFLQNIKEAFDRNPDCPNLLVDEYFRTIAIDYQQALRDVLAIAIQKGIPTPGFSSALAYYDSYRTATLPANLVQAQRDYFGAHTYERVDKEGHFHTEWTE